MSLVKGDVMARKKLLMEMGYTDFKLGRGILICFRKRTDSGMII